VCRAPSVEKDAESEKKAANRQKGNAVRRSGGEVKLTLGEEITSPGAFNRWGKVDRPKWAEKLLGTWAVRRARCRSAHQKLTDWNWKERIYESKRTKCKKGGGGA